MKVEDLRRDFDAIVLCGGATAARDLNVPGRELKGIYKAMDYLPLPNKVSLGDDVPDQTSSTPRTSTSIILGGGDTGADCLGTALRQGPRASSSSSCSPARPKRARTTPCRPATSQPWPYWPMIYRTSSAHEEAAAGRRRPTSATSRSTPRSSPARDGNVKKLHGVRLEWARTPPAAGR